MRVAVLDRNETARFVMREILEFLGHECHDFESGQECLARLSREPNEFEALLIDMADPEQGSTRFSKELRNLTDVPIIALTTVLRFIRRERIRVGDLFVIISKPFVIDELDAVLSRLQP